MLKIQIHRMVYEVCLNLILKGKIKIHIILIGLRVVQIKLIFAANELTSWQKAQQAKNIPPSDPRGKILAYVE